MAYDVTHSQCTRKAYIIRGSILSPEDGQKSLIETLNSYAIVIRVFFLQKYLNPTTLHFAKLSTRDVHFSHFMGRVYCLYRAQGAA